MYDSKGISPPFGFPAYRKNEAEASLDRKQEMI